MASVIESVWAKMEGVVRGRGSMPNRFGEPLQARAQPIIITVGNRETGFGCGRAISG